MLTLTNKDDEDHFIEHFTIENTNNTSYDIDDLIANYEYSLNLTAWVSLGPLPSSPVYNFTPTYKGK